MVLFISVGLGDMTSMSQYDDMINTVVVRKTIFNNPFSITTEMNLFKTNV